MTERVIPQRFVDARVSKEEYIDWSCTKALTQLGAASPTEIAHFMDAVSKETALKWCKDHRSQVSEILVAYADGTTSRPLFALNDVLEGDKFTGRIDLKTNRKANQLQILGLWWENRLKESKSRIKKLDKALRSMAQFIGVDIVN